MLMQGDSTMASKDSHSALSKRAQCVLQTRKSVYVQCVDIAFSDAYDAKVNPQGYVNLATSVNCLNSDLLAEKFDKTVIDHHDASRYYDYAGVPRFRSALAKYLECLFNLSSPVEPQNLFALPGMTTCMDVLAHCLADAGDVILLPTPTYSYVEENFVVRSRVKVFHVPLAFKDKSVNSEGYSLTVEILEKSYKEAKQMGNVRGLLLIHPSNPLGDVYEKQTLLQIVDFCHREGIHLISDEAYALSVFGDDCPRFYSMLELTVPNPELVHVIYGFSKDLCLPGLRAAVVHTRCKALQEILPRMCRAFPVSLPVMELLSKIMEDLDWCKRFRSINLERLNQAYKLCKHQMEEMDVPVRSCQAGLNVWIDLRKFCNLDMEHADVSLLQAIFAKAKVVLLPGSEVSDDVGWFRLSFAIRSSDLREGLRRLKRFFAEYIRDPGYVDDSSGAQIQHLLPSEQNLESLIGILKNQITAEWLECNTPEKWIAENPDLWAEYQSAMSDKK